MKTRKRPTFKLFIERFTDINIEINSVKPQKRIWIIVVLVFLCFLPYHALAGIPEPGIIIYGQVRDGMGSLITDGEISWTFTLPGDGDPLTVGTELSEIRGPGGPFSYKILIPCETAVPGFPVSDNAIPLSSEPVIYNITAQVTLPEITLTDSMEISIEDRGSINKIFVMGELIDDDGDGLPDGWEQKIVIDDPNDNITSVDDVMPTDDYDGDGFSNIREFLSDSDAAYNLDIPICWSDVFIDGDVDGDDLSIFEEDYQLNQSPATFDLDGDGDIDDYDLMFFSEDYGRTDCL